MWRLNTKRLGVVVGLASVLALVPSARAAEALFTPDCTTDNLLARKAPSQRQDLRGNFWLVTDEAVAPEGAQWDSPVAIVLDTPAGSVTYDLGQPTSVSAFYVQADANDTYKIFGSLDGTASSFKMLGEVDTFQGHGLRGRTVTINPTTVRFLRIGEGLGDGFYSISEFAAYCRPPAPFPPQFRKVDAPPARVPEVSWWKFYWFDNDVSARFEMLLALAAMGLILWGITLRAKNTPDDNAKLRRRLMMAVGIISFACYWNFGFFHFRNYIHVWDTYHYYVGSKYFPELSYDRLYECASVADAEDPGAAPSRRAAQDHEPAHQHAGRDRRDPGPPRALQGALHGRALGDVQARHRLLPQPARGQALGRGADRPRLQRDAGLEHRRHAAGEPGARRATRRSVC